MAPESVASMISGTSIRKTEVAPSDQAPRTLITSHAADPPIRFFSPCEEILLQAVLDHLFPQDDRPLETKIPILAIIDDRLYKHALNGFRYEDMLSDREVYCDGLRAIDEMSRKRFNMPFADLSVGAQELILKSLHDGVPDPPHEVWKRMPVLRFWNMLVEDCVNACNAYPPLGLRSAALSDFSSGSNYIVKIA